LGNLTGFFPFLLKGSILTDYTQKKMDNKSIKTTSCFLLLAVLLIAVFAVFYMLSYVFRIDFRYEKHMKLVRVQPSVIKSAIDNDASEEDIKKVLFSIPNSHQLLNEISSELSGDCYLNLAVSKKKLHVVKALIENGANPNGPVSDVWFWRESNRRCSFPLFSAVRNRDKDMVRLLIEKGASPTLYDREGGCVIEMSVRLNVPLDIKKILCEHSPYAEILMRHYENLYKVPENSRCTTTFPHSGSKDLRSDSDNETSIEK
jgi:hypothetical protein